MKKSFFFLIACNLLLACCLPTYATEDFSYESATGNTGSGTGITTNNIQFLGSRFTVSETVMISQVGGYFAIRNGTIFAAIIELENNLPIGDPFEVSEVVASTTFVPDTNVDTLVPLEVLLEAGEYGLVFGSGRFGATGASAMPNTGTDTSIGTNSYFVRNTNSQWVDGGFNSVRFIVEGSSPVPEPTIATVIAISALFATARRRR